MKSYVLIIIITVVLACSSFSLAATTLIYSEDVIQNEINKNEWHFYQIEVTNPAKLTIKLRKLSSNVDLYVAQSKKPTKRDFLCAPLKNNNSIETCRLTSHTPGNWYIGIHGKSNSDYQLGFVANEIELSSQTVMK
jgi:hypothetical protein